MAGKVPEHSITDKRVLRHIRKWLNAGVLEDGALIRSEEGTPQGSSISPLLANIYLHYVFDLWVNQWRRKFARGDVIVVRFCDDFVVGFQYEKEATKFFGDIKERFGKFNLELNENKTRLIEFGRFADQNRKRKGEGKPDTFDFLGFKHVCGKTKKGKFIVKRLTRHKKLKAKLAELKEELRVRLHASVLEVGEWLRVVLLGHYRYFGLAGNSRRLNAFRYHLSVLWYRSLKRRSQRNRLTWERMDRLIAKWLPKARIYHRYPDLSLYVRTQGRSPVR